jgi:hypothetical protein
MVGLGWAARFAAANGFTGVGAEIKKITIIPRKSTSPVNSTHIGYFV